MSAEGTPLAETSFLARPLAAVTAFVVRHPWLTLLVAVALAAAASAATALRLGFRTSRLDLLNPKSGYNKLWLEYVADFGDEDDTVVVLQANDPARLAAAIDDLGRRIAADAPHYRSVLYRVDSERLRAKGLYYLSPESLAAIHQFVEPLAPVIAGDWRAVSPANLLRQAVYAWRGASASVAATPTELAAMQRRAAEQRLNEVLSSIGSALDGTGRRSPWSSLPGAEDVSLPNQGAASAPQYLLAQEGRLGFILLRLVDSAEISQFDRSSKPIDRLRSLIHEASSRHVGVKIGLTGLPVMENDEMRESAASMWQANLLSVVGVSLVVIACFGGMRHPLLAAAAFMLALAWSFGYTTLVVGHLNILSAAFGAILIGIGMDFGIHYVARYVALRNSGRATDAALVEASRQVGPGIVTGGVTTAIAFFTVALTDFTGVVELGIISGGGVLLCIVAAMAVLPAMVRLVDRRRKFDHVPRPLPVERWLAPISARPALAFLASIVGTGLIAAGCWQLKYDHNLLNLQPAGLESVAIEEQLLSASDQSLWYAVTLCSSREELLAKRQKFLALPSVQRTEEIDSSIPADGAEKQPYVAAIAERLTHLPSELPRMPPSNPGELDRALAEADEMASAAGGDSLARQLIRQTRGQLRILPESEIAARLERWQSLAAGELLARLAAIAGSASVSPPTLADLPQALVERFVGRSGKHQLRIYGHGSLWDMAALEKFVQEVKSVDPTVTGKPLQTYYASLQMQRSYLHAAIYALIAITIAIILDFGNLRDPLLALLPMALGVLQMFGLMGLFNIPLNAANMIALPLLLGIGLDTGVHMVHDYRSQPGRYRVSASTAVSVLITALTTIVGFGALMIASHRGLQSLGRVMTIGATCCLFTSLVALPALLAWMSRKRIAADPPAPVGAPRRAEVLEPVNA